MSEQAMTEEIKGLKQRIKELEKKTTKKNKKVKLYNKIKMELETEITSALGYTEPQTSEEAQERVALIESMLVVTEASQKNEKFYNIMSLAYPLLVGVGTMYAAISANSKEMQNGIVVLGLILALTAGALATFAVIVKWAEKDTYIRICILKQMLKRVSGL